ncbi:hypothetical protein [Saccharothrix sp. HUAS TT1]|uniref:hypothetical protein n=1 Tax=unclassified Saccharothrix TaxID=2593673 RepID=UPI00345C5207
MANTPKALHRGLLSATTNEVVGTVPGGKRWIMTNLILTNYGTAAVNVYVQLNATPVVHAMLLTPAATFTLDCAQVLESGGVIRAWASAASSVAMHACGVEMDV